MEISCGDGATMFIHQGGEFPVDFDYFIETKSSEFKHSSFVDIYDLYSENFTIPTIKRPQFQIDVGTDWKQNFLNKASKLNFYKELVLHDNNNTPLPFSDKHFKTIFSNSIYWVDDVEALLKDIRRMLRDDGTLVLELMTPYHLQPLKDMKAYLNDEAISILDRKRSVTMPSCRSYAKWKELMIKNGFPVRSSKVIFPNKLLVQIWNIGLRPISHLLTQMTESLSAEKRRQLKAEWVNIFHILLKLLLSLEQNYTLDEAPYFCLLIEKDVQDKKYV